MFRRFLVPLDGSEAAEAVLPVADYLAAKLDATVVLLHVLERNAPLAVHGQPHLRTGEEARGYLSRLRDRGLSAGRRVEIHVHAGEAVDVGGSLTEHEEETATDLVLMCTHGRGGVGRALFGSVAQQVIARGRTPVLVVRPEAGGAAGFHCRLVLVPLDERTEHRRALEVASALAGACAADVLLLTVVPTFTSTRWRSAVTSRLLPGTSSRLLEMSVSAAAAVLGREKETLRLEGIGATACVLRGEPARTIVSAAEGFYADLVIMETHRKAGLEAFWAGSVADRVLSRCRVPVLLVPADERPD